MKKCLFVIMALLVTGCAAPSEVMVHPKTWQQMDCSTFGFGVLGTTAALGMHSDCVKKYKALGYLPCKEVEASEPAKFDEPAKSPASSCVRPIWKPNTEWTYSLKGTTDPNAITSFRVIKKDIFEKEPVYVVKNHEGKDLYFTEDIGLKKMLNKGNIEREYTPAMYPYDWPLEIGKSWLATGKMKTQTGSINLATHYEVKGFGAVKVPAGVFDAFYIMEKNRNCRVRIGEFWYSPEVQYLVKAHVYTASGRLTQELTTYHIPEAEPVHQIPEAEPSKAQMDIEERLEKLGDLLKKGLITQEDYDRKKAELLEDL